MAVAALAPPELPLPPVELEEESELDDGAEQAAMLEAARPAATTSANRVETRDIRRTFQGVDRDTCGATASDFMAADVGYLRISNFVLEPQHDVRLGFTQSRSIRDVIIAARTCPHAATSTYAVALPTEVGRRAEVRDLTIEEPDIEDLVRRIYLAQR